MNNISNVLATNILKYRKQHGFTQGELADKLGVTFQAVSKWETAKSSPDISFLPHIADTFGCSIDELFSRASVSSSDPVTVSTLPWEDDGVIRAAVYEGRKLLKASEGADDFTFEYIGEAKSVQTECSLSVQGSVSSGASAGHSITISGSLSGGCSAGNNVTVKGNLSGGNNCGNNVTVGKDLTGGCNCGNSLTCGGDLNGDISASKVTVSGDVTSVVIKGDISCNTVKCDKIEGDVKIKTTVV